MSLFVMKRLISDLIVYMRSFQEYDMDKKRDLDEIVSIINAIPHNRGFIRNGIIFEGSFDYLVLHETVLNEKVRSFENLMNNESSLGDFIVFLSNEAETFKN